MITLKNLQLKNFLSHLDSQIEFSENSKKIIEGPSGAGKSSIVEAIIWSLYGKGRVENKNIIRRGAKAAAVILELSDGKKGYKIERTVSLNGKHNLSILEKKGKAFVPLKHTGLKDSQKWIEKEFLKSSYTLFINSVAYPQDNVDSFVKQTAIKRKELLLEITDSENFDELYEKSKDRLREVTSDIQEANFKISSCDSRIKEFSTKADGLNELIKNLEKKEAEKESLSVIIRKGEEEKEKINTLISKKTSEGGKKELKKTEVIFINKKIDEDEEKLREISSLDVIEIEMGITELSNVRKSIESLSEARRKDFEAEMKYKSLMASKPRETDYSGSLSRLEGQLLEIHMSESEFCEHIGAKCPKLEEEKAKRAEEISKQIESIKVLVLEEEEALKKYEEALLATPRPERTEEEYKRIMLEEKRREEKLLRHEKNKEKLEMKEQEGLLIKDRIKKNKEAIEIIEKEIEIINKDLSDLESSIILMKKSLYDRDIEDIYSKLDQAKSDYYMLKADLEMAKEAKEKIAETKKELDVLKKGLTKMKYREECLTIAKEAFGSKGIKTVVVDYIIPRLEYRINDILSKMSDFKIRLDTQKGKYDGEGVSEGLFINIYNEAGEIFPLANYSGGQKLKITVAIAEALATMQRSGFRILDEPFTALDEESLEGFNEVLNTLQDKFSQILCISHLRSIQDSFEDKIIVEKSGNNSKII